MKLGRVLLTALLVLIVLLVAGFLYVSSNLDGWTKDAIERYGTEYAGATVTVESVSLSPLSGQGQVRGLVVGQPEGYGDGESVRIGEISVAVRVATVLDETIVIDRVAIDGAAVHAVSQNLRDTNLQKILRNVQAKTPPPAEAEQAPGRTVIIEHLQLTNTQAEVTAGPVGSAGVAVPDIELTGVGRESGGASIGQVLQQVLQPLVRAIVESIAEGDIRDRLQEQGESLRGRLEEGADSVKENLRGLFQ